jgi:predicted enzyme related to lactoylglutathione lyase
VPVDIVHIEFKSANFARTAEFYGRLFDWQTEQNASGSYMKLNGAGAPSGGWIRADLIQAPAPVAYLAVEDLEKTLAEVEAAGGRVLVRSQAFAGGGEVALFADPDGNVLGLWRRKAAPAGAAPPAEEAANPAAPGKPVKTPRPAAAKAPGAPKKASKKR